MGKKFRVKKRVKKINLIKIIFIIISIYLIIKLFNIKLNFKLNDDLVKSFISDNTYSSNNNIFKNILNNNTHTLINNPSGLLATNFYINKKIDKEDIDIKEVALNKEDNPIVYLYNSHQKEDYSMEYMEDYNVNPTVLMVSFMMKERLDKMGLYTIVEEASISDYLSKNDMKYYQSYEASRHYLINTMEKYDSIKLYIDIHRDAVTHEISTTNIDGMECAKIMFVVGKEHENYLKNLENMKYLNDLIKEKYPTITRGVLEKEGKNVNGIYNQDLGSNIMLIEVGGNYNNIVEVMNTLDIIIPIIGDYINEKR